MLSFKRTFTVLESFFPIILNIFVLSGNMLLNTSNSQDQRVSVGGTAVHLECNLGGFFWQIQHSCSVKCVYPAKSSVICREGKDCLFCGWGENAAWHGRVMLVCVFAGVDHRKRVYEDIRTRPCRGQGVGGEEELPELLYCRESKKSRIYAVPAK